MSSENNPDVTPLDATPDATPPESSQETEAPAAGVPAVDFEIISRDAIELLGLSDSRLEQLKSAMVNARQETKTKIDAEKEAVSKKLARDFMKAIRSLDDEIAALDTADVSGNEALVAMATGVRMINDGLKKTVEKHKLSDIKDEEPSAAPAATSGEVAPAGETQPAAEAGKVDFLAAATQSFKKGRLGGFAGLKRPDPFSGLDVLTERMAAVIEQIPAPSTEEAPNEGGLDASNPLVAIRAKLVENLSSITSLATEKQQISGRVERDVADAKKFGAKKLAEDFIVVVDNMDRAIKAAPQAQVENEAFSKMFEGVKEARGVLLAAFEANGIVRDEPQGEKFDPNKHESMYMAPVPGVKTSTVISVEEPGYTLNGRVLRAAKVGIAL